MSVGDFSDYLESQAFFGISLATWLWFIVVLTVAVVLERLITRNVRRFGKRVNLPIHLTYDLILTFRILILIGAIGALVRLGGLPTEWFVVLSTIGGAAIGFASTQTIGNFVAGLYLISARPFRVGDYVGIGSVEGIVHEVTLNYTRILTIENNYVSISNLQILSRDVTNYLYEGEGQKPFYCYTFDIGFDHSVPSARIAEIFNEVFEGEAKAYPKKPSYTLTRSDGFNRIYTIYIYVERPEDIFSLRPRIFEEAFRLWDGERTKRNH